MTRILFSQLKSLRPSSRFPSSLKCGSNAVVAALALCATTFSPSPGYAQSCSTTETLKFIAPLPASFNNEFGSAVALSGDWAIIGARGNDAQGNDSGAAYILHRSGSTWSVSQTLLETGIIAGNQFGNSVGMDQDIAVVGSPNDRSAGVIGAGSVSVFRRNANVWVFETKLAASDAQINDNLGFSVAISGNVVVTGAYRDDDLGGSSGSVYVFRANGSGGGWVQVQKLLAPDGHANDNFGSSVSVSGNVIVVGSPYHDAPPANDAGAAYVYHFVGGSWTFKQELLAPDGAGADVFGTAVAVKGDYAAVGAPAHSRSLSGAGAVYAYTYDQTTWTGPQTITASDAQQSAAFGTCLAIDGETLVVGAPNQDVVYTPSAGTAHLAGVGYKFIRVSGAWSERFQMRQKYIENNYNFPIVEYDFFGTSAAVSSDTILFGIPMRLDSGNQFGAVALYPVNPPDCDNNGVPDVCETDCNHNLIADVCELINGTIQECNSNGTPDECDNAFDYVLDNGHAYATWGGTPCPNAGIDLMWLNQFNVVAGGQRLTHVAAAWTGFTPEGTPGTILIYDDPNNDGDPHDAVLLATAPAVGHDAFGLNSAATFSTYPVPTTYLGPIGKSFFIGFVMSLPCGAYAAVEDSQLATPVRSWRISAAFGAANINNVGANPDIYTNNGHWLVRGLGLDCNGNGIADNCDITSGFSHDANHNNIPDECDVPCPADINHSGAVNTDDLSAVIIAWGPCPARGSCASDLAPPGGNGRVNVDDLLATINAWGICP